jgi:hypothetical protein
MEGSATDIPTFRFSAEELPERDRLPIMREVFGRFITRADFEPAKGVPFQYSCVARALPGLAVTSSWASQLACRRMGEYLATMISCSALQNRVEIAYRISAASL